MGWNPAGPEPPSASPTPPDPTKEETKEPPVEVKTVSGNGASPPRVIRRPGKAQRKATSGLTNDPLEREADHMADLIVANRESAMPLALGITPLPQRSPQRTGKPDDVHHCTSVNLPRTTDTVGTPSPIAPAVRRPLERRFGADFSRVRIHDGAGPRICVATMTPARSRRVRTYTSLTARTTHKAGADATSWRMN